MQKNLFLSILCVFAAVSAHAQAFYTQDFNSTNDFGKPVGWTTKIFNVYPGRGVAASKAIQSVFGPTANLDTIGSALLLMPGEPIVPTPMILTFQYRICDYLAGSPFAAPMSSGSRLEVYVLRSGVSYTLVKTISQSPNSNAYVSSGEINLGSAYYGREIKLIFRMVNAGGSGNSYTVQLDDISLAYQLQVVGVNERKATEGSMTVVPNPAQNGSVNLRFVGATEGAVSINIADLTGKIVATKNVQLMDNQLVTIETPLAAGVYFVTANTASGSFTQRVVFN